MSNFAQVYDYCYKPHMGYFSSIFSFLKERLDSLPFHDHILSMKIKSFLKVVCVSASALSPCVLLALDSPQTIGSITGDSGGYSTSSSAPEAFIPDMGYVVGTGVISLENTDLLLAKIKGDTASMLENIQKIQQDTQKIQKDTQKMREIEEARQQLTYRLNQITELTTQGNVFSTDPFAESISQNGVQDMSAVNSMIAQNSMDKVFRKVGRQMVNPEALGNSGIGGLSGSGITASGMIENAAGFGKNALATQLSSGKSSLNIPGGSGNVMTALSKMVTTLFGLSYNQYGFTGLGADYTQNLVGNAGRVVAMDYIPPVVKTQVTQAQQAGLSQMLSAHLRQNYRACSRNGKNPFEIIPGLYARPRTEADVLFDKMVLHGTPGSEMAFYAAASIYGGSQYDPRYGFSKDATYRLPVNMNDVLSRGAYAAVERYNAQRGVKNDNAYGTFARSIAPIVAQVVDSTPTGAKVNITPEDVVRASQSPQQNITGTPVKASDWAGVFDRSRKAEFEYIRAATTSTVDPSVPVDAYCGLNEEETKEYTAKQAASSTRLSENNVTMSTLALLLGYDKKALEATSALNKKLEELRRSSDEKSAVDVIPAMQQNAQNTILVLQNRIGQLQFTLEDQLKNRSDELKARQAVLESYRTRVRDRAPDQVQIATLMGQSVGL